MSEGKLLLEQTELSAVIYTGHTPAGSHWVLVDSNKDEVGKTKRTYRGLGKLLWRTIVAMGLGELGKTQADVLDASGNGVAAIRTPRKSKKKAPQVELFDPDGRLIGRATREADRMTLESDTGDEVGWLEFPHELVERHTQMRKPDLTDQAPLPLRDALGHQIGTLELERFPRIDPKMAAVYAFTDIAHGGTTTEQGIHWGFADTSSYTVKLDQGSKPPEPLHTLVVILPVIAAYSY